MNGCWQRDSTLRPTFKLTLQKLEESQICEDSEKDFADKQLLWTKEIAKTVKSQERLINSEVSSQDPRALLEQITAKEQDVLLKTERMNQKELQLRHKEMLLLGVTALLVVVLVFLAYQSHSSHSHSHSHTRPLVLPVPPVK